MSRKAILLLLPLLLAGCAGEGQFTDPKFVVTASGPWTSNTAPDTGTIAFTIAPNAQVVGSYADTLLGTSGVMNGRVNEYNQISGTITFTNNSTAAFNISLTNTSTQLGGNGTITPKGSQPMAIAFVINITTT